jgi:hypothetical protein
MKGYPEGEDGLITPYRLHRSLLIEFHQSIPVNLKDPYPHK